MVRLGHSWLKNTGITADGAAAKVGTGRQQSACNNIDEEYAYIVRRGGAPETRARIGLHYSSKVIECLFLCIYVAGYKEEKMRGECAAQARDDSENVRPA